MITIIRNNQKFIIYKNFEISNQYTFEHELVEDYRNSGLFLGCSSPQSEQENTRYYTEMEINHFSIIKNTSNIKTVKDFYYTETHKILFKKYYNDILCFYDFKTINNIGIVYDESKNANFLELVPKEFVL